MFKKHTIKDVAREAGVSIATVSFVLNNTPGQVISAEVRKKVDAAAKKLDYHPNAAASGLARKRTGNISIVFYKRGDLISNQYYSFVIQGAVKEAMRRELNLMFSYIESDYAKDTRLPKVVRERNTEGAIFIHTVEPQLVKDIESRGIPVVGVDTYPAMMGLNSVSVDDVQGGYWAVKHLAELEHRHLGAVFAAEDRPSINGRLRGYREACNDFHIKLKECPCASLTFEDGFAGSRKMLSLKRRPTGIVCVNDEMAAGVITAAHDLGLKVPEDVSIVGFDNIEMSNYTVPPLTTVGTDKEKLGERAVQRLMEIIQDQNSPCQQVLLAAELVVRESSGPASRAPIRLGQKK